MSTAAKNLSDLSSNTNYIWKAYSDSGCNTELATTTLLTKPGKPDKPTATAGAGSGKLTLTSSVSGDGTLSKWQYKQKTGGSFGSWKNISSTSTSLSHVLDGLTNDTNHQFKVRAVNATGDGTESDESAAAQPLDETLTASSVEATTATLTIGNYTGSWYYKYTSPTGGSCSTDAVTGATEDLTDLTPGTTYTFKAYSKSGCSELLAMETLLTKPGKTAGVAADPGDTNVAVSWTTVTGAASYKVQWKSGAQSYDSTRQGNPDSGPHTVPGLTNDTEYTFRVAAVNATGDGAWSDEVKATPKDITLTATNIAQTTATLTIGNYSKAWSLEREGDDTCTAVAANTSTKNVTGLTAKTEYTYLAFKGTQCGTSNQIAEHTFTTLDPVTLTVSNVGATGATLAIGSYSGDWYYKHTTPSSGGCSLRQTGTSATVTGLTANTSYTFAAYGASGCSSGCWRRPRRSRPCRPSRTSPRRRSPGKTAS